MMSQDIYSNIMMSMHTISQAIADDVSDHKTQYDDITGLINDYLTEFGNVADIEDKKENLTRRWNQLQDDLEKKQEAYEQEVEGLRVLEGKMAEYDEWLGEQDDRVMKLSPVAWSIELLKQQKEETKVRSCFVKLEYLFEGGQYNYNYQCVIIPNIV